MRTTTNRSGAMRDPSRYAWSRNGLAYLRLAALLVVLGLAYSAAATFGWVPHDARRVPGLMAKFLRNQWTRTDRAIRRGMGETREEEQERVRRRTTLP